MNLNDRITLITALQLYQETGRIDEASYQRILQQLNQLLEGKR